MAVTWHRFPIAQSLIEATPAATPALQTPTTTTVGAYPTFVPPGQPIVLTAEVKAQGTGGAPTGTVTFSVDGVPEAPVPLFFEGVDFAGLTLPSLPEGTHQITAQYNGDTTFASSTSAVSTQVIVSIAARSITTTTVSAAPNPATTNLRVFLTANITSTPPPAPAIAGQAATPATGLVTFFVDGTQVASTPLQLINVGTGLAQAILPALPAGTHQIVASYSGDSTLTPSTSAPFVETVIAVPPPEGPRVTSLRRYGFHAQPTSLVIGFDGPLDAFSAEDKANYLLAGPVTPRGRAAQVDPVIAALYDATANTVTLRLRDRLNLHLRYHLTIVGTPPDGVSNPSAIFLDGAGTGHPGTNFETTFGGAILAGPASALGHGTPARSGRWHARA
ncbi:MAG TPA: Ig-like domain-containing protein [Isosphaeraceae bacterium]